MLPRSPREDSGRLSSLDTIYERSITLDHLARRLFYVAKHKIMTTRGAVETADPNMHKAGPHKQTECVEVLGSGRSQGRQIDDSVRPSPLQARAIF